MPVKAMSFLMCVSISSIEASGRKSMIKALPPGFKTLNMSSSAWTGSEKFLKAALHTIKSKRSSASGHVRCVALAKIYIYSGFSGFRLCNFDECRADI